MPLFQALIFDVDGTLADTEGEGHRPAFNRAFHEAGLDWEWTGELYGELLAVTGGKERILHYMRHWRPELLDQRDVIDLVTMLHQLKTRHYLDLLSSGAITLRPGVHRLLHEAHETGIRLAVATTTTPENVTTLLECAAGPEWLARFEVIAAGDRGPAKKPAPDIFRYVLDQLRLSPRDCLVIEDSAHGVRAAIAAGLRSLLVTKSPFTQEEDFTGAALVVGSLGGPDEPVPDLPQHLGGPGYIDVSTLEALHRQVYGDTLPS